MERKQTMIINDTDALKRLNSPVNLINKMRSLSPSPRKSAMSLFGLKSENGLVKLDKPQASPDKIEEVKITFNPFQTQSSQPQSPSAIISQPSSTPTQTKQPALADILENHESQIKLGLAHDNALELLNRSVDMLAAKLDDIRADKLPTVVSAASKVVEGIRKERSEAAKNQKDREVHYHFYTPQQRQVSDYEVIDVETVPA